jgi:uncharacterized protein YdeI (YjbR/CyaY-like superfamily)
MANKNPAVDAYIEKAADFAQPILSHLRSLVHKACPQVEEAIKWGFPHFTYKNDMLCHMAAFKQHCVFGFWKASLMKDDWLVENAKAETAMGHYGKIKSLKDLPADKIIMSQVKEAMKLNDEGKKVPKEKPAKLATVEAPEYFLKVIAKNKKAWAVWEKFSNSCKKEYVEWITEAKREETREKRIEKAGDWMAEGKDRNWKYKK